MRQPVPVKRSEEEEEDRGIRTLAVILRDWERRQANFPVRAN